MHHPRKLAVLALTGLLSACKTTPGIPSESVINGQPMPLVKVENIERLPDAVHETSGLAIRNGIRWTLNDSGDAPVLYALNRKGELQTQVQISGARNRDWESLAQDQQAVYIADTGNNRGWWRELNIFRVSWAQLEAGAAQAEAFVIRYADQPDTEPGRTNFDSEALTKVGDEFWLFSKNWGDGQSRLYRFRLNQPKQTLTPSQTLAVNGLITGADYRALGEGRGMLALLGYSRRHLLGHSFVWQVPVEQGELNWNQAQRFKLYPYGQWEAIHWLGDQRLQITAEKSKLGAALIGEIRLEAIE